jgi:hypothetical protein
MSTEDRMLKNGSIPQGCRQLSALQNHSQLLAASQAENIEWLSLGRESGGDYLIDSQIRLSIVGDNALDKRFRCTHDRFGCH